MTNWNNIGKIKAAILAVLFILNLIFVSPISPTIGLIQILFVFVFGAFSTPLMIKINSSMRNSIIEQPSWNENPISKGRTLVFSQFVAWFMIINGIAMVLGSAIIYQVFNSFGLTAVFFGFGTLVGIELTLKWL
jgi:hypothetical protein